MIEITKSPPKKTRIDQTARAASSITNKKHKYNKYLEGYNIASVKSLYKNYGPTKMKNKCCSKTDWGFMAS